MPKGNRLYARSIKTSIYSASCRASSQLTAETPDSRLNRCTISSSITFWRSALTSVARTSTVPLEFKSSLYSACNVIGKACKSYATPGTAPWTHYSFGNCEVSQPPPKASISKTLAVNLRVRMSTAVRWSARAMLCVVMTAR
jgi:hypothetical protein